ncbi:hypothetical protein Lalb_Chr24g0395511 [Lupinus albus]|uniref:Uncharacterized protein n=1 Tax=Lupinus albus TaxID=3870 RepID=A0A6A4NEF1_LUPAL|nr:hypothetical protein Lalb_Chr24g0395511 [Lupinus albus]
MKEAKITVEASGTCVILFVVVVRCVWVSLSRFYCVGFGHRKKQLQLQLLQLEEREKWNNKVVQRKFYQLSFQLLLVGSNCSSLRKWEHQKKVRLYSLLQPGMRSVAKDNWSDT